ncbi:hypothetical protein ECSTEC94C_3717 [Escherichia coli STEC_94C]|nr:hypothetical protein ECSTEC94C_3717 [Escherichia coli STEC_94C]
MFALLVACNAETHYINIFSQQSPEQFPDCFSPHTSAGS